MGMVSQTEHGELKNRVILVVSENLKYSSTATTEKYRPDHAHLVQDGRDMITIQQLDNDALCAQNRQQLIEQQRFLSPTSAAAPSSSGSSTLYSSVSVTSVASEQVRREKQEKKRAKAEARRQARASVARAWEVPYQDEKITQTPDYIRLEQEGHLGVHAFDAQPSSSAKPSSSRHRFGVDRSPKTLPNKSVFKLQEVAEEIERLIAQHGSWSIGFLDAACDVFLTANKTAAISFKRVSSSGRSVAVIFGDPLCSPAHYGSAISEFKTFCRNRRMLFGFVGAGVDVKNYAARKRWLTLQFASERMVNPESNPILSGQSRPAFVRPLELKAPDIPSLDAASRKPMQLLIYAPTRSTRNVELETKAQHFYDDWCAQKGQAAHATTFSDLFALSGVMTYIYTKSPFDDSMLGLVAIMKVANGGYLLDPVVAHREAPSCTTDFLRLAAMAEVKKRRGKAMSFGAEPRPEIQQISGMVWPATDIARRRHRQAYQTLGLAAKRQVPQKFALDPDLERPLYLVMAKSCVHIRSILAITNAICAANNFKLGDDQRSGRHRLKDLGAARSVNQSANDSSASSGSSTVLSVTSASTTSLVMSHKSKLPPKLLSFVCALNNLDATTRASGIRLGGQEDTQEQRLITSTLTSPVSLHGCPIVHGAEEMSKSSRAPTDTVAECVSWCLQQLDSLNEGNAATYAKANRIYFHLGRTYEHFCEVGEVFACDCFGLWTNTAPILSGERTRRQANAAFAATTAICFIM
ncbi:hypothetical protein QFC22_004102 [Naganishia vaughanmartiniae]|uniref:Uncharacterized protein n=1 Tax=Naganishia vaughanmartiniae TaxID=1424756 RepID=A0ACC2X351_9TREE|nr:hypothetical protein QFC22_004102 [Naganishia vaughanmartiniae]